MITIQPIEYDGRVAALVFGERALIGGEFSGEALAVVQAKCLYALEIEAQTLPGPYAEPAATRFARNVLTKIATDRRRQAPVIRLPAPRARRVNR